MCAAATATTAPTCRVNTTASASASITPAAVTSIGGVTAADMVFDALPGATLDGKGKAVRITGLALTGADASSYLLLDTTAAMLADPAALSQKRVNPQNWALADWAVGHYSSFID